MGYRGSLDWTFVTKFFVGQNLVRLAFGLVLYDGFLTRLSQPLDTVDKFSTVYRPSRTAHL